jgi:hypothetical protein
MIDMGRAENAEFNCRMGDGNPAIMMRLKTVV